MIREVLVYGSDCRVTDPPGLVARLREQIQQIADLYRDRDPLSEKHP